ncbi:hypothetical protein MTR_7g015680 [Medicago truncatula]|uniref:Retrovirus-related Pol polyprotein from transposon TNT 1-94-like beta-barrel domain-containing protein n=1 Tax=Medicago truncatula TaxID=3880 RepID=A0A072U7A2_MEDTR|nr:hypothetical protein MTR_7g015680 [Medicago truncatula]
MIQQMVIAALSRMGIHGKSPNVSRPWFLDSGASNHMTGSSEYLHNLHSYDGNQKIQIADGNTLSITTLGDINSGFRDVLVSPGLASNLLFKTSKNEPMKGRTIVRVRRRVRACQSLFLRTTTPIRDARPDKRCARPC